MREHRVAEEWLPTRFNHAVFRMLGLAVAALAGSRRSAASMIHHDRAQHPFEAYALTCALVAVPSLHLLVDAAPLMPVPWLTIPLAALALPFVAVAVWDAVVFSVALLALLAGAVARRSFRAIRLQGPVIHGLMLALAAASIGLEWRSAWLGWAWIALVALNALCALALAAARGAVDRFVRSVREAR